jgi:hypothetical protein
LMVSAMFPGIKVSLFPSKLARVLPAGYELRLWRPTREG